MIFELRVVQNLKHNKFWLDLKNELVSTNARVGNSQFLEEVAALKGKVSAEKGTFENQAIWKSSSILSPTLTNLGSAERGTFENQPIWQSAKILSPTLTNLSLGETRKG